MEEAPTVIDLTDSEVSPTAIALQVHAFAQYEAEAIDHAIAWSLYESEVQAILEEDNDDVVDLVDDAHTDRTAKGDDSEEVREVRKCACCLELLEDFRVLPCQHVYCMLCIATRCRVGVRDRSLVPAQCCRKEFPVEYVASVLTQTELDQYNRFVSEREWRSSTLQSDAEYIDAVTTNGFKICPECGVGVERITGCNKMTCLAGHSFCFNCGLIWKTCLCDYP